MTQPAIEQPLPLEEPQPHIATHTAPANRARGGNRGCIYLMGGCMGTLVLIIAVLGAGIAATGSTVSNFFNGFTGLFTRGGSSAPDLRGFTIPSVEPFTMLSALTTLTYNYSGAVGVSTDMPALIQSMYGTSQVLIAVGSVEAGVDLSALTGDDMRYNEATNILIITLPGAAITNCYLDEQRSYVAQRTSGPMAPDNVTLESAARRMALAQFVSDAQEGNLLTEAQTRAELIVTQFAEALLSQTGREVEVVVVSNPVDATSLPASCAG